MPSVNLRSLSMTLTGTQVEALIREREFWIQRGSRMQTESLRLQLQAAGIEVTDNNDGTSTWYPMSGVRQDA